MSETSRFCHTVSRTVPVGKGAEGFACFAPRQEAAKQGFEALGQRVGRDVAGDLAPEAEFGTAAAAKDQVIPLDLLVAAQIDLGRDQADIADIMLGAGIRAAGQVDVDRRIERDPRFKVIG